MPTCSFSRTRLTDHREAVPFSTFVDAGLCRGVDVHLSDIFAGMRSSSARAIVPKTKSAAEVSPHPVSTENSVRPEGAANPASPVLVPLTAAHGLRAEAAQGLCCRAQRRGPVGLIQLVMSLRTSALTGSRTARR